MKIFRYITSVVALFVFVFCMMTNVSSAATLSFFVPSTTYTDGSDITINIMMLGGGETVDSVSGLISFSHDLLSVSSITKDGTVVDSWIQEPSFSNTTGHINFEGELSSGNIVWGSGKLFTIKFKAKKIGEASIAFVAGSVTSGNRVYNNILTSSEKLDLKITDEKEQKYIATTSVVKNINPLDNYKQKPKTFFEKIRLWANGFLAASIFLLVFLLCYVWYLKRRLTKETKEAESSLHRAFVILKKSVQDQIRVFKKEKSKQHLNPKDEVATPQLKKDLKDAEKFVEKEISDIEDLINK